MNQEILKLVLENAKKNSVKELSVKEIERIISETESELGLELSGYGVKDKPYRQYFSDEVLNSSAKKQRIARTVIECSQEVRDKIAYRCGKNITFGDLEDNIIKYAYIFKQKGIKKGDIISICTASVPEAIFIFFAANLIGASLKPIDPIMTPEGIKKTIEKTNSKLLITLGVNYLNLKTIANETGLDNVIYLSMKSYMPFVPKTKQFVVNVYDRVCSRLAKSDKQNKWVSIKDYMNSIDVPSLSIDDVEEKYDSNEIAAYFSTSGSSGQSKDVSTTNEAFLDSIERQKNSEFDINADDSLFNPMPPSSSYFWYDIVLAAVWQVTTSLSPFFNAETGHIQMLEDSCTVELTGPIILDKMCDYIEMRDLKNKPVDLSKKKYFISGGDLLVLALERRANRLAKEHGCNGLVTNALGTSETCGPAFNPNGILKNKRVYSEGSIGAPFPGNDAGVFAFDEENECRLINSSDYNDGLLYYDVGEICHNCNNLNVFKDYYKDEAATAQTKIQHSDGTWWYHTGDLGYMDPTGHVFCAGRKSGLIVRAGHKVWAPKIVNLIKGIDGIKDCAVIGVPDANDNEVPACFIVYNENVNDELKKYIITKINLQIAQQIDTQHIPLYYENLNEIPRNLMLKVKTGELTKMFNEKYNKDIIDGKIKEPIKNACL